MHAGFDFVRIYDGSTPDDPMIAELHGQVIPFPVEGLGPNVLLQLDTDASAAGDGFLVNFECVEPGTTPPPPPDPCIREFRLMDHGALDKTGGYSSNHDCRWVLSCSNPAMRPLLTFSSFDLETGFDFVRLFEGQEPSDTPLFEFHGQDVPLPTESPTQIMLVQLTSDSSVGGDGFAATFDCVFAGSTPPPPPDACTTGLDLENEGVIDKTGGYGHRHDCRWLLHCTDSTMVPMLTFSMFDLETGARHSLN